MENDKKIELYKKLEKIDIDIREYELVVFKEASSLQLEYLEDWWITNSKDKEVPKQYKEFISRVNGFDFDALSFYSLDIEDENNLYESNLIYWESDSLKEYISLGEDSISWYCYSNKDNKFYILDKPSGSLIEKCTTFNNMACRAFESIMPMKK